MVTIALATENDISQVLEIEQEAFSPPWTRDALLGEIGKNDSFFVIAKDTTEPSPCARHRTVPCLTNKAEEPSPCFIAGFAIMRQVGDDGELLKIAVDNSARGKGIGDLLMKAILEEAKRKAFPSVFLEVRSSNTAAIRLYEKHGFNTVRVRKDYYNDPVEDAIVMCQENRPLDTR